MGFDRTVQPNVKLPRIKVAAVPTAPDASALLGKQVTALRLQVVALKAELTKAKMTVAGLRCQLDQKRDLNERDVARLQACLQRAAAQHGLPPEAIMGRSRSAHLTKARLAFVLAAQDLKYSHRTIGQFWGGRTRAAVSNVLYQRKRVAHD